MIYEVGLKKILRKEFFLLGMMILFLSLILHGPSVHLIMGISPLAKGVESYQLPSVDKGSIDPNGFNVLIWNVYKGQMENWEKTFQKVAEDKDILILQEAFLGTRPASFWQRQRFNFYFAPTFQTDTYKTGVATLSKAQSFHVQSFYSKDKEPVIQTAKAILLSLYEIKDHSEKLAIINIHGLNFVSSTILKRQIKALQKILKDHQGPVLFAGDFNTWSGDKADVVHKLLIDQYKLREVQFEHDERTSLMDNVLDRVFLKNMDVLEKNVLKVENASDHNAIYLKLRIN